jgi:Ni/Fe-hydrogenase subunit HybB-like protein
LNNIITVGLILLIATLGYRCYRLEERLEAYGNELIEFEAKETETLKYYYDILTIQSFWIEAMKDHLEGTRL